MNLFHYSIEKIQCLEKREYEQKKVKFHCKPNGLWVSVEGDDYENNYNWKQWCQLEGYALEHLSFCYEIILKENSNLLYLENKKDIFDLAKKYPFKTRDWDPEYDSYQINWSEIKKNYQGIIITPYQWDCRLALESSWYYGWDCSSGCIWDLDAIKEFNFVSHKLEEKLIVKGA